jgi:hypothetical protein
MGQDKFNLIQYGLESVNGTAVAADTVLLAQAQEIPPDRAPRFPIENAGVRMDSTRVAFDNYLATYNLVFPSSYFQAYPVIMSILLAGNISPAEQTGGQGDYLWDFTPDLSFGADNDLDSLTLEVGDDTQALEMEYVTARSCRISGTIAQDTGASAVSLNVPIFGRQLSKVSYTGAISIPTVNDLTSKLTRIYLDTSWAGVGGTEVTSLLRGFDIDIIGGAHPKFYGSANRYFDEVQQGPISAMFALTLERSANSITFYDDFVAGTFGVMRLTNTGPQIGSGDNHSLVVDIGGYFEGFTNIGQTVQGNNLDLAVFRAVYDETGNKGLQVNVTTNLSGI